MTATVPNIAIAATSRSPEVHFDFTQGIFLIRGEAYPEDSARFFGPLLRSLRDFLDTSSTMPLMFEIELVYFNSSTAKALMNLFQVLEIAADGGREIRVNWHFAEDDETMREFGEDFALDFKACSFNLCPRRHGRHD
jgi:hypothetical protein